MFILKKNYKRNLVYGAIGMAICYLAIIILYIRLHIIEDDDIFNSIYIGIGLLFIVCFEFSVGPII